MAQAALRLHGLHDLFERQVLVRKRGQRGFFRLREQCFDRGLLIETQPQGDNLYRATEGSGEPMLARAGEDGAGSLAQGWVEASNVKMVDEMVNLMLAQRAYEASVKVVQAADEMLGLVNNLRK